MKVDRIEIYHVKMPLIYPWRTAYGDDPDIYSLLVKMVSEEHHGWGETTPFRMPTYSPEWAGGAFALTKEFLAPALAGRDIDEAEDLLEILKCFKGNPFAKAGLEAAWWVLKAKLDGKPLHRLLGGKSSPVEVGADFGVQDSVEILLRKIGTAIEEGYPRVKLKFRRGWDIDMLKTVRDNFPDFTFHIDCNSSFSLKEADLFKKVDRFNLAMIEQPLNHRDLIDHAKLQKQIATPICLDESITSPEAAGQAIEIGSCRYMNVKYGRVGGLLNAVKIHNACRDAGIPCWVGGMLESTVGSGICIELATLSNFKYPSDIFPSKIFYRENLASPEIDLSSPGRMDVSKVPGTPYEPKGSTLKHYAVEEAIVKA